jgi:predicted PhzF superfamily epimerase YddE/YHI9
LASAYALSLRGHDTWPVRFHTVSGLLTVNRDHGRFEMDFPSRPAVSCEIPTGLLSALGLEMAEVMRDPRDFLIVVDHAEIVRNLKPDIAALAKIDMGISGGAIVTASGDNPVHTRPILGRTHWQANISSAATQFSRRPNVVHASWRPRKDRW